MRFCLPIQFDESPAAAGNDRISQLQNVTLVQILIHLISFCAHVLSWSGHSFYSSFYFHSVHSLCGSSVVNFKSLNFCRFRKRQIWGMPLGLSKPEVIWTGCRILIRAKTTLKLLHSTINFCCINSSLFTQINQLKIILILGKPSLEINSFLRKSFTNGGRGSSCFHTSIFLKTVWYGQVEGQLLISAMQRFPKCSNPCRNLKIFMKENTLK